MKVRRILAVLALAPFLNACLYVELTGTVAGASVTVTPLRGGPPVVSGLRTMDASDLAREQGESKWQSFDRFLQLLLVGRVEIPTQGLKDDKLYLVTASGGFDMDWNGDRLIDDAGLPIDGEIHAVMTGAQLKRNGVRVNILTDAIYHRVADEVAELDRSALRRRLDELASEAVPDMDGDGKRRYEDALLWSRLQVDYPYPGSQEFLWRAEVAIALGLDEEIMAMNSESLVDRADWQPDPDSPYAEYIVACTVPVLVSELCTMGQLPLIGQQSSTPAVADVMPRVITSHDWMRRRFEEVLYRMPQDMLMLLRSVTAVVIGDDVRPSYYDPVSATIFLDADVLWVTAQEGATVSQEEDYRAEFARRVNFSARWRYVKDNDHAFGELDENGNSSIEDVSLLAASLLFHELAHAGDFLPPARHAQLPRGLPPVDAIAAPASDGLRARYPLQSEVLRSVASVLYGGVDPTPAEAAYTGAEIGKFFAGDRASALYAYYTQYEDFAMLFEEAMMAIHFGIQRDTGFTSRPASEVEDPDCSDYRVGWGMRGRIAEPQLADRLELVMGDLLPERDYRQDIADLPDPVLMDHRRDWCENLVLGEAVAAGALLARPTAGKPRETIAHRRRPHRH